MRLGKPFGQVLVSVADKMIIQFKAIFKAWMIDTQVNAHRTIAVPIDERVLSHVGGRSARPFTKQRCELSFHMFDVHLVTASERMTMRLSDLPLPS